MAVEKHPAMKPLLPAASEHHSINCAMFGCHPALQHVKGQSLTGLTLCHVPCASLLRDQVVESNMSLASKLQDIHELQSAF